MRLIGGIFGRSAFGPIHEHMVKVQDCAHLLPRLIESLLSGDFDKAEADARRMDELEGAADEIKNEIRESISHSFFSSAERGDIVLHLKVQDDIADACQEIAKVIRIHRTRVPEALHPVFRDLTKEVCKAVNLLAAATSKLHKVVESSYDRGEVQRTLEQTMLVRRSGFEVEKRERAVLKRLFEIEDELEPVSVFFLMLLVEELCHVANEAENSGDSIVRMVSHRG